MNQENHTPEETVSAWDLLGIAPEWTGGKSVDDWMNDERDRNAE